MDKKAWVSQLKKHIDQFGEKDAPWYVFWNDPDGKRKMKSCGPGKIGLTAANKLADQTHAQLVTGTYKPKVRSTWEKLRSDYDTKIAARFDEPSRIAATMALNNFERVANPKLVSSVNTDLIDGYVAKRLEEFSQRAAAKLKDKPAEGKAKKKPEAAPLTKVSPATINKELRYVRLILNVAKEWGYIQSIPKIRFLKLPKLLPTYIPPDHFTAIYAACEVATKPGSVRNVSPAAWWRALIVTAYMTGWRIGQLKSLRWADVNLEEGTAIARADVSGNKGKREEKIPLHPLVVAHLSPLAASFDQLVFPWTDNPRDLWPEFHRIQESARLPGEKPLPKGGKRGRWYGFHDLRRGFATMNAATMDLFELQGLMQHKSLETTRGYVNMAKRYNETVENLFVPQIRVADVG